MFQPFGYVFLAIMVKFLAGCMLPSHRGFNLVAMPFGRPSDYTNSREPLLHTKVGFSTLCTQV